MGSPREPQWIRYVPVRTRTATFVVPYGSPLALVLLALIGAGVARRAARVARPERAVHGQGRIDVDVVALADPSRGVANQHPAGVHVRPGGLVGAIEVH